MLELVKENNDGKLITELKTVCEYFNKKHYNIMRDIKSIISDLPDLSCEFIPTTYTTDRNKTYDTYYLTEKGFYLLTSSFTGKKARQVQSKFFDAFQQLKQENKMLIDNYYLKSNTYCISDIVQKFKGLKPVTAQGVLFSEDVLEFRQNGIFPTEYYESNDSVVSVLDYKRGRYYPRYTLKGVLMVEEKLIEKGYKYKGID